MNIQHLCAGPVIIGLLSIAGGAYAQDRHFPRAAVPPDHATVYADQSVLIDVLANDAALGPGLQITHVGQPARGSMAIEDNQIRYTPPAGESGFRAQGGYLVRSSNGNAAMGLVSVEVVPGTGTVHLQGRVPGVQPTCSLEAEVADAVVTGCVDAQGRYELSLHDAPLGSVVQLRLNARVHGGSVESRWMSLPGSVGQLLETADGSATVDETQFPLLSITPFTTAQSALITSLNSGEVPFDMNRLSDLRQVVDAYYVRSFGGLFHAVLRGQVALPPGFSDAFDLIIDVHAAKELGNAHFALVDEALEELAGAADLTIPYDQGLSGDFVSSVGGSPSAWTVGSTSSHRFEFGPDGQGRYVSRAASTHDEMSWTLGSQGELEISGTQPYEWVVRRTFLCPPSGSTQVEVHFESELVGLRRMLSAPEGDIVALRHWTRVTNRDTFPEDCFALSNLDDTLQESAIFLLPRDSTLDFVSLAELGEVGLVVHPPSEPPHTLTTPETRVGGTLDFSAMLADIPGFEQDFTAALLLDGRLRINLQATPEHGGDGLAVNVRRARGSRNGAQLWAKEFVSTRGWQSAEHAIAVPVLDASEILEPDGLVGFWEHGFYVSSLGSATYPAGTSLYWVVPSHAPDTMVQTRIQAAQAVPEVEYFLHPASGIIHATAILHDGAWRPDCPAGEVDCSGFKRVWQPLAVVEVDSRRRIYMIETLWTWNSNERDWDLLSRRMNFVDERDSLPVDSGVQPGPEPRRSRRH